AIGDLATVSSLLEANPAVLHVRGPGGRTALSCAVSGNQLEMAKALLEKGADPNQPKFAQGGVSVLHSAAAKGFADLAQLLTDHGAAVDPALNGAQTPLEDAVSGKHWATVNLLISAGANVNRKKPPETTPLYRAAEAGRVETVRLLLSHGAEVDVVCSTC